MARNFVGGAGGNRTTIWFLSPGFTRLNYRQNRSKLYGFAGFRTISYKSLSHDRGLKAPGSMCGCSRLDSRWHYRAAPEVPPFTPRSHPHILPSKQAYLPQVRIDRNGRAGLSNINSYVLS